MRRSELPGEHGQPAVGNAGSDEERVSTVALLVAMELICGMSDHPAAIAADQAAGRLQQAAIGPGGTHPGVRHPAVWVLQVFNDADVDMIVGSVTRRLRRLQLVPEPVVL